MTDLNPLFHACMIAGTHSGVGKTTVMFALEALARRKGLTVQPFKGGPDYIDPGFHHMASMRKCRNLDLFLLSPETVKQTFARTSQDADLALVEGMMGLFDGKNAEGEGSSAEIAKLLEIPVILVVDGSGLAGSAAAIVLGFQKLDPNVHLSGVIFNFVNHDGHFQYLKRAVESKPGVACLGFLPREKGIGIPERHLGLITAVENKSAAERISQAGALLEKHLDWEAFLRCSSLRATAGWSSGGRPLGLPVPDDRFGEESEAIQHVIPAPAEIRRGLANLCGGKAGIYQFRSIPESINRGSSPPIRHKTRRFGDDISLAMPPCNDGKVAFRIGVARDEAFSFYYEDNFDLLREAGAELCFFSPLEDRQLPENLDLLYFGGGFPELYAERLSANQAMIEGVRRFYRDRGRIYAECGGLMFLAEFFCNAQGREYALAGLVPGKIRMTERLQNFGYKELETASKTFLFDPGKKLRSHEFHYSIWDGEGKYAPVYRIGNRAEGFVSERLIASYQHLHFGSDPEILDCLKENLLK